MGLTSAHGVLCCVKLTLQCVTCVMGLTSVFIPPTVQFLLRETHATMCDVRILVWHSHKFATFAGKRQEPHANLEEDKKSYVRTVLCNVCEKGRNLTQIWKKIRRATSR
jgi:hypothetical protein